MIVGGIVLHNPNISILKQNIEAIYPQVDRLVLVDNNSDKSIVDKRKLIEKYSNVVFIQNHNNEGVAKALNQIMKSADSLDANWVLTLDQDSICPPDTIETFKKYIDLPNIAIITPMIIDINEKVEGHRVYDEYEVIGECITSSSLNNIEAWKSVNGFDEKMFIDFVDFEYSYKVREKGYKIIRVNSVSLLHRLGNLEIRKILHKNVYIGHHNAIRKYYYVRNAFYCHRKHKELYSLKRLFKDISKLSIKVIFFEEDKLKKISSMAKGVRDGVILQLDQ